MDSDQNAADQNEVLIENSITRVTVQHQFEPNNHYKFFLLHTLPLIIAFNHDLGLNVLFYQFYAKIMTFYLSRKVWFGSSLLC